MADIGGCRPTPSFSLCAGEEGLACGAQIPVHEKSMSFSLPAPNDTAAKTSTTADHNRSIPKTFTLLYGCSLIEDHDTAIQNDILTIKTEGLKGEKGLRSLGFQFRFVPCCPAHIEEDNENYEHMICAEINKPPQSPHPPSRSCSAAPRSQRPLCC